MCHRWLKGCLLGFGCAFSSLIGAADIHVSGHWSRTVNNIDLAAGPGSEIAFEIQSPAAVATLAVTNTANGNWSVNVARNEINWPPGVSIAVRRSGNESGVAGGMTYVTLTNSPQLLFTGNGDRDVQIQLKVEGLSVHTLPALYSLTITYSVQTS